MKIDLLKLFNLKIRIRRRNRPCREETEQDRAARAPEQDAAEADRAEDRAAEAARAVAAAGQGRGGNCVCPSCGEKVPHQSGTPCYDQKCPKCGEAMMRE